MSFSDLFRRLLRPSGPSPTPVDVPTPGDVSAATVHNGFPFPLVTVHGSIALDTWRRLHAERGGWPVVLGGDEDLAMITEGLELETRTPKAILAAASLLTFPQSLLDRRAADTRAATEWLREHGHDPDDAEDGPPLGDWPDAAQGSGFTVATDVLTGQFLDKVHIAVLPCRTGAEAPAYLRWGNWNDNPVAEHHVAALRYWHERHGAELVGMTHDVVNLHVATRPATREAALALAREQHAYCADIVDQGVETLSALAATLMADDWWYFWWD